MGIGNRWGVRIERCPIGNCDGKVDVTALEDAQLGTVGEFPCENGHQVKVRRTGAGTEVINEYASSVPPQTCPACGERFNPPWPASDVWIGECPNGHRIRGERTDTEWKLVLVED
jgi:hypothetical protein